MCLNQSITNSSACIHGTGVLGNRGRAWRGNKHMQSLVFYGNNPGGMNPLCPAVWAQAVPQLFPSAAEAAVC